MLPKQDAVEKAVRMLQFYFSPANLVQDKLTGVLLRASPHGADLNYINRNYPKLRSFGVETIQLFSALQENPVLAVSASDGVMYVRPKLELGDFKTCYVWNLPQGIHPSELSTLFALEVFSSGRHIMCRRTEAIEARVKPARSVELQQQAFAFYQRYKVTTVNFSEFKYQIDAFVEYTETPEFYTTDLPIEKPRIVKVTTLPPNVSRLAVQQAFETFGRVKSVRLSQAGGFAQVFFSDLYHADALKDKVEIAGSVCQCVLLR